MPRRHRERIRFKDYDPLRPQDAWRYNGHPFRWGLALVRPVRFHYGLALVILIIASVTALIPGIVSGRFVDDVLRARNHEHLALYIGLIFGVPAARGLIILLQRHLFEYSSQHALHRTRDALYQHLQKLDQSYYGQTPTGTIMAKMTGDIDMVRYFLAWAGYATFEQVFMFVLGSAYLIFLSWRLALVTLVVIPFLFLAARKLQKHIRPVWQRIRRQFERLNAVVQVNISGNRVTRAFVRADYEIERFEKENVDYSEMNKEGADIRSKYIPIMDGLSGFMAVPVILVGGILVINGQMSAGELVTFNSLLWLLSNPTRMLGFLINDMQHYSSSASKIIELLMTRTRVATPRETSLTEDPGETEAKLIKAAITSPRPAQLVGIADEQEMTALADPATDTKQKQALRRRIAEADPKAPEEQGHRGYVPDKPFPLKAYKRAANREVAETPIDTLVEEYVKRHPPHDLTLEGEVVFDHVSYSYNVKGQPFLALSDITFTARPGETIGIIGETGAGKSSLVELIPRMDDPTSGRILIDGRDLRTYPLEELRRSIGVVTQEVFLFSDTVEGNIAFVDPLMPESDVLSAANIACADDFIRKMEFGYETVVGERGVGLSGGQRQRISLARAIAGDPSILILDDTTSAVDMNTDAAIRDHLAEHMGHKTVFIIAQRISSIRNADQILVMERGEIKERGTHASLIEANGIYASIYRTQMGDQQEALKILGETEERSS